MRRDAPKSFRPPHCHTNALDLNFLTVWREEGGKWRFLAWKSCKNPPPAK